SMMRRDTLAYTVITADMQTPDWTILLFFTDAATTEIYTLSLHDALPIYAEQHRAVMSQKDTVLIPAATPELCRTPAAAVLDIARSEEHTSELQSLRHLVCRLLLEKKKNQNLIP